VITRDPLDGVDGETTVSNPYHYVDNDPLNKTDPLGLRPCESFDCFVKASGQQNIKSTPVPCPGDGQLGFPPALNLPKKLGSLRYDCRLVEVENRSTGFWPTGFSPPQRESSTKHLGLVALKVINNGPSEPNWLAQVQILNKTPEGQLFFHTYEARLTPNLVKTQFVSLGANSSGAIAFEAETDSYYEDARIVTQPLTGLSPHVTAPTPKPNSLLFIVRKNAVDARCRQWKNLNLGGHLPFEPWSGDWMRCSDVELI